MPELNPTPAAAAAPAWDFRLLDEADRLEARAASLRAEARLLRWIGHGCPCDRSGVLGVSLLDPGPRRDAPSP